MSEAILPRPQGLNSRGVDVSPLLARRELRPTIIVSDYVRVIRLATDCGLRAQPWGETAFQTLHNAMTAQLEPLAESLIGVNLVPRALSGYASMAAAGEFARYGAVACNALKASGSLADLDGLVAQGPSLPEMFLRELRPTIMLSDYARVIRLATDCRLRAEQWAQTAFETLGNAMQAQLEPLAKSLTGVNLVPLALSGAASMAGAGEFERYGAFVACNALKASGSLADLDGFVASARK